jgi:arylsulfatase A-like enzyme
MKKISFAAGLSAVAVQSGWAQQAQTPNVVLIYADDLGFGDISCNGTSAVQTPNIDRLASGGLSFSRAYASSATCTPSRYSLLTGEYAWRRQGTGILSGDASMIIEPGRCTLPAMLRSVGYRTGVVGKWHLGLGDGAVNWNGEIRPGPLEIGFDYSFLIPATGDRVPCVFVENHRIINLDPEDPISVSFKKNFPGEPTGKNNPELLKMMWSHGHNCSIVNGISRMGYMKGGAAARWVDEDMADTLTGKALEFIQGSGDQPFFLYFATHDIHVPRAPHSRFAGKSGLGPRGDAILQLDWCVGQILDAIEARGLAEKTLIVFSSDNGPVLDDGYVDDAVEKLGSHQPWGPMTGTKYSSYEAGTRVPFLVSWPGRIVPGRSEALISQVDLLASLAALTGGVFDPRTAPDSQNHLDALLGQSAEGREWIVEHAFTLSLASRNWKYIAPYDRPTPQWLITEKKLDPGMAAEPRLFNLSDDPFERKDVADAFAERAREMAAVLKQIEGKTLR